jgi:hypothetical protein
MSKIKITQQQMRKLQESLNESVIVEQTLDQVKEIQSRLKKCFNANLGNSGPNKDGVDGIAGKLTKQAIEQFTDYRF